MAGKPALPIRCGVFHTRLMIGCPQWQATQGSSIFGGWQANLAKHVAVSATLTFATPQAAYANPLRSANFYIILNNYAICASAHGSSRPAGRLTSFMQKSGSRISPDTPPAATRGSVMSLRGLFVPQAARSPQLRSGWGKRERLPARKTAPG